MLQLNYNIITFITMPMTTGDNIRALFQKKRLRVFDPERGEVFMGRCVALVVVITVQVA